MEGKAPLIRLEARGGDMHTDIDELMTVKEIAAQLKVPVSWVYQRTRRRGNERIPHLKLGKYLRFSASEVTTWLQQLRQI
jgi:excisionase family DNA binding protein